MIPVGGLKVVFLIVLYLAPSREFEVHQDTPNAVLTVALAVLLSLGAVTVPQVSMPELEAEGRASGTLVEATARLKGQDTPGLVSELLEARVGGRPGRDAPESALEILFGLPVAFHRIPDVGKKVLDTTLGAKPEELATDVSATPNAEDDALRVQKVARPAADVELKRLTPCNGSRCAGAVRVPPDDFVAVGLVESEHRQAVRGDEAPHRSLGE